MPSKKILWRATSLNFSLWLGKLATMRGIQLSTACCRYGAWNIRPHCAHMPQICWMWEWTLVIQRAAGVNHMTLVNIVQRAADAVHMAASIVQRAVHMLHATSVMPFNVSQAPCIWRCLVSFNAPHTRCVLHWLISFNVPQICGMWHPLISFNGPQTRCVWRWLVRTTCRRRSAYDVG